MKFPIEDFFSKCDLWLNPQETSDLSHLQNKSLMKSFIFCAVIVSVMFTFFQCFSFKTFWKRRYFEFKINKCEKGRKKIHLCERTNLRIQKKQNYQIENAGIGKWIHDLIDTERFKKSEYENKEASSMSWLPEHFGEYLA